MELCKRSQCTGCLVCKNVCPQHAIDVRIDTLGFAYPIINSSLCADCGLCKKACHVCSPVTDMNEPKKLLTFSASDNIRINSSSGGFFSLIAAYLYDKGYYVAGVVFDKDYLGVHYVVTKSYEQILNMRKSKYVEAALGNIYEEIKEILENDEKVLFVGLPCHVAGLLKYLGGHYRNNILTVDLMCYGNGSPALYERSLTTFLEMRGENISSLKKVDFRHKPFKKRSHTIIDIETDDKTYTMFSRQFPYYYGYVNRLLFRESCYSCIYSKYERASDITIGDIPGNADPLGKNVILCNTSIGLNIVQSLVKDNRDCFGQMSDLTAEKIKNKLVSGNSKPELYLKISECGDLDKIIKNYLDYRKNKYGLGSALKKLRNMIQRVKNGVGLT